jgi:hypothetical protein
VSIRPTGRLYVLKAHAANPWEKCLMEFIAMSPVQTQPKSKTKAKPDASERRRDDGRPRFVGIDLHKEVATFHVVSQDGTSLHTGSFAVNPDAIREFASVHLLPADHLAVEVTSNTWAFVRPRPISKRIRSMRSSWLSFCVVITFRASGYPHPPSKTAVPSPLVARLWSISAPRFATGFMRCWRAG